jgi:GNAT superfamily N-acetyltransferase
VTTPRFDPPLAALLGRVWPALPGGVARGEELGAWAGVSTPFVRWEGGRAVGHGASSTCRWSSGAGGAGVGSIHAVCTDPDHHGHGLGAALMRS